MIDIKKLRDRMCDKNLTEMAWRYEVFDALNELEAARKIIQTSVELGEKQAKELAEAREELELLQEVYWEDDETARLKYDAWLTKVGRNRYGR